MTSKKIFILGAGGHARVVFQLCRELGLEVGGFIADQTPNYAEGIPSLSDESALSLSNRQDILLANGIGTKKDVVVRKKLFETYKSAGFEFATLVHPRAVVAKDAMIGEGSQIMAGAVVQTGATIGINCIVNTSASIDHDCVIGDHCHIAPGIVLCGGVQVADSCLVGAGTVAVPSVKIQTLFVRAGTIVTKDLFATLENLENLQK